MSAPSPSHVLFADDDRQILSGLRRQLHRLAGAWRMTFVPGGPEAVAVLNAEAVDVVVTDMRMPVVDGAAVLAHAASVQPDSARLVLSGHADPDRMELAASCCHRYLHKPCASEHLEAEIQAALAVREAVGASGDDALARAWSRPPGHVPGVSDLLAVAGDDVAERAAALAALAARDASLWEPIRLVASAWDTEGLSLSSTPEQVVAAVGPGPLTAVALALAVCEVLHDGRCRHGARVDPIQRALAARRGARRLGLPAEVQADAFVAGLLHDTVFGRGTGGGPGASGTEARLRAFGYLLPTWGIRPSAVALLERVHGWCERREAPGAEDGRAAAALLATRRQLHDPDAALAGRLLDGAGWTSRLGLLVTDQAR